MLSGSRTSGHSDVMTVVTHQPRTVRASPALFAQVVEWNADHNAALNHRDGFVEDFTNWTFVDHKTKPKKKLSVRKRTGVGQESPHDKTDVGA